MPSCSFQLPVVVQCSLRLLVSLDRRWIHSPFAGAAAFSPLSGLTAFCLFSSARSAVGIASSAASTTARCFSFRFILNSSQLTLAGCFSLNLIGAAGQLAPLVGR